MADIIENAERTEGYLAAPHGDTNYFDIDRAVGHRPKWSCS
jgi:hypothetical protein